MTSALRVLAAHICFSTTSQSLAVCSLSAQMQSNPSAAGISAARAQARLSLKVYATLPARSFSSTRLGRISIRSSMTYIPARRGPRQPIGGRYRGVKGKGPRFLGPECGASIGSLSMSGCVWSLSAWRARHPWPSAPRSATCAPAPCRIWPPGRSDTAPP